jgi:hypothetical protein
MIYGIWKISLRVEKHLGIPISRCFLFLKKNK